VKQNIEKLSNIKAMELRDMLRRVIENKRFGVSESETGFVKPNDVHTPA